MIDLKDIEEGEIIKALVSLNEVEAELFARVYKNTGTFLEVKYLLPTEKLWKGACVYELDDTKELIEPESLCEHYQGIILFDEVDGIQKIPRTPYYYFTQEKDDECSDDEIVSEDEDGYEIDDEFCVDDGTIDGRPETQTDWQPPPGHEEIDR